MWTVEANCFFFSFSFFFMKRGSERVESKFSNIAPDICCPVVIKIWNEFLQITRTDSSRIIATIPCEVFREKVEQIKCIRRLE